MKKVKKKRKRKPVLNGWQLLDTMVIHNRSGRAWLGIKQLKKIGKFFIKAAEWIGEKDEK